MKFWFWVVFAVVALGWVGAVAYWFAHNGGSTAHPHGPAARTPLEEQLPQLPPAR